RLDRGLPVSPTDWVTLFSLLLPAAAAAVYKQWIPNTNFETASNWEKGRVPCASDVVRFEKNKVSYLPLNGEFVLASGAGFAAFDGSWDPGATVRFADAEHHAWFNPTLWQAVSPDGELEPSGRIFSVDEERVPCRYDDVIFQPETSFRVNVDSSQRVIHLRSISLMGQVTRGRGETSSTPPRHGPKFHGNGTLRVTGTGCPDKSGCACGNAPDGHRICAALLGVSGRQCPAPACQSPLQPLGHCCGVCGDAAVWGAQVFPNLRLLPKARVALLNRSLAAPKPGTCKASWRDTWGKAFQGKLLSRIWWKPKAFHQTQLIKRPAREREVSWGSTAQAGLYTGGSSVPFVAVGAALPWQLSARAR
uniref:Protein amnionless n=1 Tax=Buteo japonicus TaxID=224669 RepID=A0A8C0BD53_9AVES